MFNTSLEAILFAILISVSCDFVIHFGHAYSSLPGEVDRHERTQTALLKMGPSILAAAVTSIGFAIIMLFTVITFFEKFAIMLFFTILQATIGSFIVFLTLCDCFGPSEPTYLVDAAFRKMKIWCNKNEESEKSGVEADFPESSGVHDMGIILPESPITNDEGATASREADTRTIISEATTQVIENKTKR